jgi:hypothetical protein
VSGKKYDQEKADYSLLDLGSLEEVVHVLDFGAHKYSRSNWQKVKPARRYFAACLRHLARYRSGEATDSETGRSHLAHAVACLMFLLWHEARKTFSPKDLTE